MKAIKKAKEGENITWATNRGSQVLQINVTTIPKK